MNTDDRFVDQPTRSRQAIKIPLHRIDPPPSFILYPHILYFQEQKKQVAPHDSRKRIVSYLCCHRLFNNPASTFSSAFIGWPGALAGFFYSLRFFFFYFPAFIGVMGVGGVTVVFVPLIRRGLFLFFYDFFSFLGVCYCFSQLLSP